MPTPPMTLSLTKLSPKLRRRTRLSLAHAAIYNAGMMLRQLVLPAVCAAVLAPCLPAQKAEVERPPIVGIAQISLKTNDLNAAREFYGHYLGYEQVGTVTHGMMFKVNDHQYIAVADTLMS